MSALQIIEIIRSSFIGVGFIGILSCAHDFFIAQEINDWIEQEDAVKRMVFGVGVIVIAGIIWQVIFRIVQAIN